MLVLAFMMATLSMLPCTSSCGTPSKSRLVRSWLAATAATSMTSGTRPPRVGDCRKWRRLSLPPGRPPLSWAATARTAGKREGGRSSMGCRADAPV